MHRRLDRKTFVTTLGAAGLGLGLAVRAGAAPVQAHDQATPAAEADQSAGPLDARLQTQTRFYADFTAALANQLRASSADAVDAAVRKALMAVLDARRTSGELTYGQAEALKTLIATTPAPLDPGPLGPALLGFHPGMGGGVMHDQGDMNAGGMMPSGAGGMADDMARGQHGGDMHGGGMPGSAMSGMGGMADGGMPA
ncbi:MAG TPA: hypothetical protein VFQ80_14955, partial [Thermomicrobiales bacterium]|nr:hypothetical protein [Thermomicrobiales bacterium]